MGIAKPCTHLHPPPPNSFQLPSSFLKHPQRYKNQNIAHNWAISPTDSPTNLDLDFQNSDAKMTIIITIMKKIYLE